MSRSWSLTATSCAEYVTQISAASAIVLTYMQRDNALKEMRSKVHLLESTLAKHLKAQVISCPSEDAPSLTCLAI